MKRAMAAMMSALRQTAMAAMDAVLSGLEVSVEEEAAEGVVMLMESVEKSEPVKVRRAPGAGSCLQPASRARRTGGCVRPPLAFYGALEGDSQFAVYVVGPDCRQLTQLLMLVP